MSFGPLSTLGTGGAAGRLVIGVDAEPSLNHHYTVMPSVFTVLIFEGTAGNGVAGLLVCRSGVWMAGGAVLLVRCEAAQLSRLEPFTTGARARAPVGGEPLWCAGLQLTGLHR